MGGQGSARSSPVGPSGLAVSHLVLSSRTVWVRCPNGEVARRYGVSERNPAGDYWKKIPGSAHWLTGETGGDPGGRDWSVCPSVSPVRLSHPSVCLSVLATPDDDLWAVTPVGGLSRRLTKLLPQTQPSSAPSHTGDDVDDEWELL